MLIYVFLKNKHKREKKNKNTRKNKFNKKITIKISIINNIVII